MANSVEKAVFLASPRGFCAGVIRALDAVERTLATHGAPVFVFHEIVHNDFVVEGLRRRGVVFVDDLDRVPVDRPLIFSAHGVSSSVEREANRLGIRVIDATCPLVRKIHRKAAKLEADGVSLALIGDEGHPEIVGTLGRLRHPCAVVGSVEDVDRLDQSFGDGPVACLTQTTLSVEDTAPVIEALRRRFPTLRANEDMCYATRNRQGAVKLLATKAEAILVLGSEKSSNSKRLREVAEREGAAAFLIRDEREVDPDSLRPYGNLGVTAAASAPEVLVERTVDRLRETGWTRLKELIFAEENVRFDAPPV